MYESKVQELGPVNFPTFTSERIYMQRFEIGDKLPEHLTRWQPTIDQMLNGTNATGHAYLMVDQSTVVAGESQRRPGKHIDGYWDEVLQMHGENDPHVTDGPFTTPEALLLASSVTASQAFEGLWQSEPAEGGDCEHINMANMKAVLLKANTAYAGPVTMIHESLPVNKTCRRTLVRLNVPGLSV